MSRLGLAVVIAVVGALGDAPAIAEATVETVLSASAAEPIPFIKGHTWGWVGRRGEYTGPRVAESMEKLAATGADWVCIAFAAHMPTYDTPEFRWGDANPDMVSDDEIRGAIALARDNGLRVILKPTVNCSDGTWRAWIRFYRPLSAEAVAAGVEGVTNPWAGSPEFLAGQEVDAAAWDTWWDHYARFLEHYARLAADERADAFCVGCEMTSTEQYVERWRDTLARVRARYDGPLTYNANHGGERNVRFLDAVDFISVSGYYPVPPADGQTEAEAIRTTTPTEQIEATLVAVRDDLRGVAREFGKPIVFLEAGLRSVRGCARYPWSHPGSTPDSPIDEQEQARYYEAMLSTFWDEPWFRGFAWWDWPARLYPDGAAAKNRAFCIYGKEAEAVVREWYAKPR